MSAEVYLPNIIHFSYKAALLRYMSSEAYQYLYDTPGFHDPFEDTSAAEKLPLRDPDLPPDTTITVTRGMDQIPKALMNRFLSVGPRYYYMG
jgi:hypothetical protein